MEFRRSTIRRKWAILFHTRSEMLTSIQFLKSMLITNSIEWFQSMLRMLLLLCSTLLTRKGCNSWCTSKWESDDLDFHPPKNISTTSHPFNECLIVFTERQNWMLFFSHFQLISIVHFEKPFYVLVQLMQQQQQHMNVLKIFLSFI